MCMLAIEVTALIESLKIRTLSWIEESAINVASSMAKVSAAYMLGERGYFMKTIIVPVGNGETSFICCFGGVCIKVVVVFEFGVYNFVEHVGDKTMRLYMVIS